MVVSKLSANSIKLQPLSMCVCICIHTYMCTHIYGYVHMCMYRYTKRAILSLLLVSWMYISQWLFYFFVQFFENRVIELFWSPSGWIKINKKHLGFTSLKVSLAAMENVVNLPGYSYLKAHSQNWIIFWEDEFMKSLKNFHHCLWRLIIVFFAVTNQTFWLFLYIFCQVPPSSNYL